MADFTIKQGDTGPALRVTLKDAEGNVVDVTSASVKFNAARGATNIVDHGDVVTVNAAGGVVEYQWQAADTATSGELACEFEVTFSGGEIVSFPNETNIAVTVVPQVR